jgi:hypothetical protein
VKAETRLEIVEARAADVEARLREVESTRTWRLRGRLHRLAPLRALARATGRGRGR